MLHTNRFQTLEEETKQLNRRVEAYRRELKKVPRKMLAVACPMCGHVGALNYFTGKGSCLRCGAYVQQKGVVKKIKGGRNE